MTEETAEQKIARYEYVLDAYVRELTTLREENERLRSAAGAHEVLKSIYLDEAQASGVRVKAAQAALPHEKPRLAPVEAPMELVAEPYEPLAVVVERQRARARAINALPLSVREAMVRGVAPDITLDGNGRDDDTGS
jgi:hypothetical protein